MDMITLGFQCDIIRSASVMYDGETGGRNFGNQVPAHLVYNGASLDSVENHIGISHSGGRDKCITRDRLYMNIMVYLINKLKQAKDPSGSSIIDNTIIVNGYAVSDGNHSNGDGGVPIIVGGGRNLINPGDSYDVSGYDMRDLLYSINVQLNMGMDNFVGANRLIKI